MPRVSTYPRMAGERRHQFMRNIGKQLTTGTIGFGQCGGAAGPSRRPCGWNVRASELTSSPPASVARTSARPSPSARAACSRVRSRLWAGRKINSAVTVAPTARMPSPNQVSVGPSSLSATETGGGVAGTATRPVCTPPTTIASNSSGIAGRRAGQTPRAARRRSACAPRARVRVRAAARLAG